MIKDKCMDLYKLSNEKGDMIQYVARYSDEYMLCLDFIDGKLDTYNVLEIDDFEGINIEQSKVIDFNKNIKILFFKFLFTSGFNGGDESDL